ncbi:TPT-domain-containing protein [Aureobasidium namibiae CBS 147.97]|uniref:TPT-domain-containing protein n=1 Tax=Aureobasidium namibiae CBS 147.97 TaxID=1043004 RepID=A0A074WFY9_9PEZI
MDSESSQAGSTRRRGSSLVQQIINEERIGIRRASPRRMPSDIPEAAHAESPHSYDDEETNPVSSGSDWEMDDIRSDEGLEDDEETGLTKQDRQKRTRRKRRNTLADERIVPDGDISKEEERLASASFMRDAIINCILIGLWYTFSISISVYNKWMFSKGNLDFHFPLFTTCVHMLVQFFLSSLVLYFIPNLRPKHKPAEYAPVAQSADGETIEAPRKPLMTGWFYLTRIGPCGAATGLDIGLGNMSLKFISLTFYTMCKSSVLGFVLVFALAFRLEKPSLKVGAIILTMMAGVVMMVAGETAFSVLGFILVMSAAFFSGFRWSLTQILLLRSPATSNPFSSIFFLAPVMFAALLVIALPVEGPIELAGGLRDLADSRGVAGSVGIILFPGVLAFLMTASEFALLKRTSAVTLSVCGIFKEVLTISAAGIIFGDKLTPINISGLVVTIASIAAYNVMKMRTMRDDSKREAHEQIVAAESRRSIEENSGKISKEHPRKTSTAGAMIRNSLSLNIAPLLEQNTKDRASPVKRPEDHD